MMRVFAGLILSTALAAPAFDVADVHVSPRTPNPFFRTSIHNGRYEIRYATMLDLIRTAYTVDPDKVYGGPSWLEFDRFDITAAVPPNTSEETRKQMLQQLLADRFKLVVHNDTKPVAGFVLSQGKGKPKLKEADPAGKT